MFQDVYFAAMCYRLNDDVHSTLITHCPDGVNIEILTAADPMELWESLGEAFPIYRLLDDEPAAELVCVSEHNHHLAPGELTLAGWELDKLRLCAIA